MTWLQACETSTCVQVAIEPTQVIVRSSQDPDGPRVAFTHGEWTAFLTGARDGVFDI